MSPARSSIKGLATASVIVICLVVTARASARVGPPAGALDLTFGTSGKVVTDFGFDEVAEAVATQKDGKILAAGGLYDPSTFASNFAVARYLANGSLDTGFGDGGKTVVTFAGQSIASGLAVLADGKIVLAGQAVVDGSTDFALARLNSDGSLDASFGANGKVSTDFGGTIDAGLKLALQPDGKLLLAGITRHHGPRADNPYDFALARYNADGSLDSSFGAGGHTTTDFGGTDEWATGIALQADGKIVLAGSGYTFGPPVSSTAELARYNSDGSLDTTFDNDGRVTLATTSGFGDVTIAGSEIVAASGTADGSMAVVRYSADGSLDQTFGSGGIATAHFGDGSSAWASGVAVQPDGEIVAAGATSANANAFPDFAVARFNPNGRLDPAFGNAGTATTDVRGNSQVDMATGLALQKDGKIVLAGLTAPDWSSSAADFALVRYVGKVCAVPKVTQRSLAAAKKTIAKAGCTLGTVRRAFSRHVKKGRVVSEKPRAGTRLQMGAKVALVVSRGRHRSG